MTLYATRADLDAKPWAREVPILADLDNDGAEDAGVVDEVLASASAEIQSKVAGRTDLALSEPYPRRLADIACDIARYLLHGDKPTEHVRQRYEDAVRTLNAVRDGVESFGLDGAGSVVETPMLIQIENQGNVFGREAWSWP